jgi:Cu-processing system permease protein
MTVNLPSILWLCARQELVLSARSRWIQTFAVVFALLAVTVAASGYILSGGSGVQDFSRTAASLLQIVLLIVPLTSLLFGVTALTPERGEAELLFSQPVARVRILIGKVAGLFLALVAAQAIGFGAAGLVLFWQTGNGGVPSFLGVISGSVALTAVFLGISAVVVAGESSDGRARGMALALVIWFGTVLLFDVAVLGIASLLSSGRASRLLMVAAIVNPVDAVRTGGLLALNGTAAFGAASLAFLRFTGGAGWASLWLLASVATWIAIPIWTACLRLRRADI